MSGDGQHKSRLHSKRTESLLFSIGLFLFQVFMVVLYAVWVRYDNYKQHSDPTEVQDNIDHIYGYFRDVNIMIFFGFGFLMVFLRRYGYSALGYTFVISAMVAQWSVLLMGFMEAVYHGGPFPGYFYFDVETLINGLFCAGAVMISYGAILGKVTPLQMLIMGIIEPMFYFLNMYFMLKLNAFDVGGVCWFLTNRKAKASPENAPSYTGDLFSMAGTLFLWMMWPSFNAGVAPRGDPQLRAITNTFLSLTGSTISTFIMSRLCGHYGYKLDMVHVQNSTLAGGVVQGVLAALNIYPASAIAMGFIVGAISVLGYVFLTPLMTRKLSIQDTCGIHNLHGMPGFIGAIGAVIAAQHALNHPDLYSPSEFKILFPAGDNQAKNQAAMTFISVGLGIVGGLFTGAILYLMRKIGGLKKTEYFSDHAFWNVATDYPKDFAAADTHSNRDEEGGSSGVELTGVHSNPVADGNAGPEAPAPSGGGCKT
ncbi:hypothetical protein SAMD00019534_050890, partial [Acytostelium subglobosum LB1]|uniref:hypothetical protein n=1 Tax=Acytostelium subglobosum LB1 TaxID=1410327 RepID=UPI000644C937